MSYSEDAVTDSTDSIAALLESAQNHLASGDARAAVRDYRGVLEIDSDHIEAHHGLIRALRDAGLLEQAVGVALALTAITPNDPLAHAALSISLQHAGHIPEAEAASTRARILEWKQQLAATDSQ